MSKNALKLGQKAPLFCLKNQDEVEICLRDLVGKWVILYFYPKDNTPGCTTEACDFSDKFTQFINQNAIIIGVSPDSIKKHQNFIAKHDLNITLLSDEAHEVLEQYGVWQLKKNYGKEYMGVLRSTFIIDPEGILRKIYSPVKVANHAQIVFEDLQELKK